MKILIVLITSLVFSVSGSAQTSIDSLQMTGANNQTYPLNNYLGLKVMFFILPSTQTPADSAFIQRVDSIAITYQGKLKVFAVPSYEDGYVADSLNTIMNWYHSLLDTSITISIPLYTHVASGIQQDGVFNWLTHSAKNTQFDYEITGNGTMFFINTTGGLYGIIGPEGKFSSKALNRVLP